jgi:hypothetical protein
MGFGNANKSLAFPPLNDKARLYQAIRRASSYGWGSYSWASLAVVIVSSIFMATEPRVNHWFLLPAMGCGLLLGVDAVRLFQGSLDPFDPKGIIGVLGFYGFFLAPVLHVYWNYYTPYLDLPADPRNLLGLAQSLNALGIVVYKLIQYKVYQRVRPAKTAWKLRRQRVLPILWVVIPIGIVAECFFYHKSSEVESWDIQGMYQHMEGTGWLIMLGDMVPMVLFISYVLLKRSIGLKRDKKVFITLFILFLVQLVWSGLRGSRTITVISVFWAAGLIHHYWRRIKARHLYLALIGLLVFMYVYGLYKGMRVYKTGRQETIAALLSGDLKDLEIKSGRTMKLLLLGDLARADVQAKVVQGVAEDTRDAKLMEGRTYLLALSRLIPRSVWTFLGVDLSFKSDWHRGKAFAYLVEGDAKFLGQDMLSSRVYGLSGEAMLNFGFLGVPVAWAVFAFLVGWFRKKMHTLLPDDTRWTLIPLCSCLIFSMVNGDFDNIIAISFRTGFVVTVCTYWWSRKLKLRRNLIPGFH